jgi:hypothetical protein
MNFEWDEVVEIPGVGKTTIAEAKRRAVNLAESIAEKIREGWIIFKPLSLL